MQDWLASLKGEQGEKGDKGDKGDTGAAGRGIDHMEIIDGELWVYYTDGTDQNLGSVGSGAGEEGGSVLEFVLLPDGTYGVRAGEKASEETVIEIPNTYNNQPVTTIMSDGFYNLSKLRKIILPENMTSINEYAFYTCSNLREVVLSEKIEKIGQYAFYGCENLSGEIDLPNVDTIEKYAFYKTNLAAINLDFSASWNIKFFSDVIKNDFGATLAQNDNCEASNNASNILTVYDDSGYSTRFTFNGANTALILKGTATLAISQYYYNYLNIYEADWTRG